MSADHATTLAALATTLALLMLVQQLARGATGALVARFGWSAVPWTTGWLGVPVHELSHALACILTRRRIRDMQLFAPNPQDGSMGSVTYESGPHVIGWLSGCVIGLAPLGGGTIALFGLAWLATRAAGVDLPTPTLPAPSPDASPWLAGAQVQAAFAAQAGAQLGHAAVLLWHKGSWWRGAAVGWAYASACIAAHLVPSRVDVAGAWRGALLFLLLIAGSVSALLQLAPSSLPGAEAWVRGACAWVNAGLTLAAAWLAGFWVLASGLTRILPGR